MNASAERHLALAKEQRLWTSEVAIIFLTTNLRPTKQVLVDMHSKLKRAERVPNWARVFCLCVLAQRFTERREAADGLTVLSSISSEERGAHYAPEIHRLEGELRRWLPSPDIDEIECCFKAALAFARQRETKSLELRAALSLARLWRDQGKCGEAAELLNPINDWFSEGFKMPDLMDAKTLLDHFDLLRTIELKHGNRT